MLERVSLELAAGEYVAIMGDSGVGKSTLLNLIAGLDHADGGDIAIGGVSLAGLDDDALTRLRRRSLGFVFQAFHVLPHLDVAQNIGLPLMLLQARDRRAALCAVHSARNPAIHRGLLSNDARQRTAGCRFAI